MASADVVLLGTGEHSAVLVNLNIGVTEPPCGTLAVEGVGSLAFSGWLDLLRVLSEALESGEQPPLHEAPAPGAGDGR